MSTTPHELIAEFPAEAEKIQALKVRNGHFARLLDEYAEVNRAVYDAESRLKPTDDAREEELRRQRLALKDEIWKMLQAD